MDIPTYRKIVSKKKAALDLVRMRYRQEKEALNTVEEQVIATQEAQELTQQVAQQVQEQAHAQIAEVVSRSLEAIFDDAYEFRILFEKKRGKTEARLVFIRDGKEIDPMTASGGGVVDVAAFALRLSCLMLSRPPLRRLLILDEPFKFVSEQYRDRIRILLETLAKEMNVQFLMVTHIDQLRAGKIVELPL